MGALRLLHNPSDPTLALIDFTEPEKLAVAESRAAGMIKSARTAAPLLVIIPADASGPSSSNGSQHIAPAEPLQASASAYHRLRRTDVRELPHGTYTVGNGRSRYVPLSGLH